MFPSVEVVKKAAKKIQLTSRAGRALPVTAVAFMLAAVSVSAQAPLDVRVALIIGNSAYAGAPLLNPANDAKAMADVLKRLGFTVIELRDGNKAQMAAAIAQVSNSLKGKQGVGMFYYAGHGLQLDWRNYMVPVDAQVKNAADVMQQTLDMSSVVDVFKAAGNRMSILVLDACRDNPFGGNTSSAKGLAQLDAPPGTFLAYATAPGNVAEDGDEKSGNGLYTQFLLQELKRPTTRIEDVFKRVRLNVRKQSNGRQIPWESTSLEDDFFFNDGVKYTIKPEELERMVASALANMGEKDRAGEAARLAEIQRVAALTKAPDPRLSKEQAKELAFRQARTAWEAIKTSANPDDFYNFLILFPGSGDFAESAQYRFDQLSKPKITAALGQGQDASLGYLGDRFKVGDEFQIQTSDLLTNVPGDRLNHRVTSIEGDTVKFNNGALILSALSALVKTERGTWNPPSRGLPAEFLVGKKWDGRSTFLGVNGIRQEQLTDAKVIGRETITVPAGTFQTFVVESTVYSTPNIRINFKHWIDPRYGVPIKSEELARNPFGILRSERRELIAIKADRS